MTQQRRIIYVPIEPLSERYTEQWFRQFPKHFEEAGFECFTIAGRGLLQDDIKVGTFLDINSTVHYKMSQLMAISSLFNRGFFRDGDIFFFGDIEFWGLESVRLMAQMNKVDVKITGFLHAASYTMGDAFAIAAHYQQFTEIGWIAALDKVFVGSEYHKKVVQADRLSMMCTLEEEKALLGKIVVTKNPIFKDEYKDYSVKPFYIQKEKKFVLTNRLDAEKNPVRTLELFQRLKSAYPDWRFVVTTGRKTLRGDAKACAFARRLADERVIELLVGLSKEVYHMELQSAAVMVSHSPEENYGYCIAEAIHYGVVPLLYNVASHPEFVNGDDSLLFKMDGEDYMKAVQLINKWGTGKWPQLELDYSGMDNIIAELREL